MGGDGFKEMCKQNLRGEEKGKARKQATSDGFGRERRQKGETYPPGVAKFNYHGYDSLGVEWQPYGSSLQTTPRLIYRCEALDGIG